MGEKSAGSEVFGRYEEQPFSCCDETNGGRKLASPGTLICRVIDRGTNAMFFDVSVEPGPGSNSTTRTSCRGVSVATESVVTFENVTSAPADSALHGEESICD